MDIFQIAGVCVLAAVLAVLVRQTRPELSLQIGLAVSAGVFLLVLPKLSQVLSEAQLFLVKTGLDLNFFVPIAKITAIAYIAQFATEICLDAGERAIASKVEVAAKILIAAMALPIITGLFDVICQIIS